jgi:hypothetical protein
LFADLCIDLIAHSKLKYQTGYNYNGYRGILFQERNGELRIALEERPMVSANITKLGKSLNKYLADATDEPISVVNLVHLFANI